MLNKIRNAATVAFSVVAGLLLLAGTALATPTDADVVGTSLGTAVTTAKEVISDNMPLVFGVAVAFVAWNIGRRVLGRV